MTSTTQKPLIIHYGWIVAVCGAVVIFSSFGLARYAYTMLLPAMQSELGLAYSQMGMIGTANFAGYLSAVLFTPFLIRRFGPRAVISTGLFLIALALYAISFSSSYSLIMFLYTFAGIGGGLCNIPMMALITEWFASDRRGRAVGIVVCGNGTGIIFTGLLIPVLNRWYGATGWRHSWEILGFVVLGGAITAALLLRNSPDDLDMKPIGCQERICQRSSTNRNVRKNNKFLLIHLGLLYWVFGVTFMVYGTFIVETMISNYGLTEAQAGFYWSWIGVISFFSGVLFGSLSDKIGRKYGIAIVYAVQTAAYVLVGFEFGAVGLLTSIICYGLAVFAIPTIMAAAAGDYFGNNGAAGALAMITIFFAAGQAMGPGFSGIIVDVIGGFGPVYLLASVLTALAVFGAFALPPTEGK